MEQTQGIVWLLWLSLAVGVAASVDDLRRRRVSNYITLPALGAGLALRQGFYGWGGTWDGILGGLIGFVVFLIFFLIGGMGGGDIKLMAGFGAIIGRQQVLTAALMTAIIGGVMALLFVVWVKLRQRLRPASDGEAKPVLKQSIPYAPAITLGVWLSFLSEDELWTSDS